MGIWQPVEAFWVVTTRGGGCYWHPAGGTVKSPKCAGQPSQLRPNWPLMSVVSASRNTALWCWERERLYDSLIFRVADSLDLGEGN